MSLAADIITLGVCSLTSGVIGYTIRDIQADRQARRKPEAPGHWVPLPTETAEPVDITEQAGGLPPPIHRTETGTLESYGVTQVDAQCANPRCRREHPDSNVVLIGVGLSGSVYHCRYCRETW